MSEKLKRIPLCQLRFSKRNVRKTDRLAGVEELANNIRQKGLLQNLVVRPAETHKGRQAVYEVDAGSRRLAALRLLVKRKHLARDHPVPCMITRDKNAATEVSLAENFMRAPPHPADQFEAFAALVTDGLSVDDIAARFGITPVFVEQRLRLAAVSPRLIAEYRAGAMTLEQLTAFTLSGDHRLQEEVWFDRVYAELPAHMIRRLLTKAQVEGNDRRARFVGAQAYQAAGGLILRDLFDSEDEGYFSDSQLLDRLVSEKLQEAAEAVRAEGWQWVEVQPESDLIPLSRYRRAETIELELGDAEQVRLQELSEKYDALVESLEEELDDAVSRELNQLSAEISAFEGKKEGWADEERAKAGAIVSLAGDGTLKVLRGLLKTNGNARTPANEDGEPQQRAPRRNGYSDSVLLELSAHRTAALQETLASQPENALLMLMHALVDQLFYNGPSGSCLRVVASPVDAKRASDSVADGKAMQAFQARQRTWSDRLPEQQHLWSWLVGLDPEERPQLLAVCVAMTVDALDRPSERSKEEAVTRLALATGLDMRDWWQPTRENFLKRLTKNEILAAVSEGVSQQASWRLASLKKDRMTKEAEKVLAASKWLPLPLRTNNPVQVQQAN